MAKEDVQKYLLKGLDCAQTVLSVAVEEFELDIDEKTAQTIAAGFGGGMFSGETCGAVTGAIMAIGLTYGHSIPVNQTDKDICSEKVLEFKRRFTERRGSTICRELLDADMSTPEGAAKIAQENLLAEVCPNIMADACTVLIDMLDED